MDRLQHHLAQTLKAQRATRGWSLAQAAQITGVSKAMLGQIERAESSPTIATLWKIASGFNLPFSAFIAADIADHGATRSQRLLQGYRQPNHGMQIVPLFPTTQRQALKCWSSRWRRERLANPARMSRAWLSMQSSSPGSWR